LFIPRVKLIQTRKSKGLQQKDVAKAVGITTSYYGMIELGKRNPDLEKAKKIADYFSMSVDEIFFCKTNNNLLNKLTSQSTLNKPNSAA